MFDDALRKIHDLRRRAESLEGTHTVSFTDLFNDEFMLRNTDFATIEEMLEASGFKFENVEDFEAIPADAWNQFVCSCTRFSAWSEMQSVAGKEWLSAQLGFEAS